MKFDRNGYQLGFVDTLVKAAGAVKAAGSYFGDDTAPGAIPGRQIPGGTVPAGAPVTVSPPISVSPAMQQAFTPQFAPVMTMQQDSPGAQVTATPMQTAPGGQAARTGAPGAPPGTYPGDTRGDWPTPLRGEPSYARGPAFPEAFPDPFAGQAEIEEKRSMTDLLKTGIIAAVAIGAIQVIGRKNGKRKKK